MISRNFKTLEKRTLIVSLHGHVVNDIVLLYYGTCTSNT